MLKISVLTTYYNAPIEAIRRHYEYIMNSTLPPLEWIIVNDGCVVGIRPALLELKGISIVYAKIPIDIKWNLSGATNLGIWLSAGNVISLEECDHYPMPNYYAQALRALGNGADRFYAHYVNEPGRPPGNCVIKKNILTDIGGYDEDFAGNYGYDDILLTEKLNSLNLKTDISQERLIYFDRLGETVGVDKDTAHNKKLVLEKIVNPKPNINILRFPYTVERI
jgi:glycosyltransferase involved in cell wall biosynthesis